MLLGPKQAASVTDDHGLLVFTELTVLCFCPREFERGHRLIHVFSWKSSISAPGHIPCHLDVLLLYLLLDVDFFWGGEVPGGQLEQFQR
jgi:hypothetical protein